MDIQQSEFPLISVIIPVFNAEDWVSDALSSVSCQSYSNLDIIVVNDGSTDSSLEICNHLAKEDKRIRVISQENQGLAGARNSGLDIAEGQYVIFVDSDDIITRNHISMLYDMLLEADSQIAVTNLTHVSPDKVGAEYASSIENLELRSAKTISAIEAVKILFYQGDFDTCAPAKLYPKELWEDVRFPQGYIHEDLPTVYKVILKASKVAYKQSVSYLYRTNPTGLNHSVTNDKKAATLQLVNEVVQQMEEEQPELLAASKCFRCSFCFHLLLNSAPNSLSASSRETIEQTIKQDRKTVLADGEARKKTRIACFLSYIGFNSVQKVFDLRKS